MEREGILGKRRPRGDAWGLWLGAVAAVALGCSSGPGGGGGKPDGGGNPAPTIVRVEVAPAAALLGGPGQSRTLTAHAFDAQGNEVSTQFTWTSSRPSEVGVDSTGRLTANALGSAQVSATAGGLSSPGALILVAETAPGAVLVTDAQVVSVGPVIFVPPDEPGVGTQYEVRLRGVSPPPAVGTVLLAAETALVAGKVVSTRDESGTLVVTLELRPMYEVFRRYHLDWDLDVVAYDVEGVLTDSARVPGAPDVTRSPELTRRSPADEVLRPFNATDCKLDFEASLFKKTINLGPTSSLHLLISESRDDPNQGPTFVKHVLVGSFGLVGTVELGLNAGLSVSGGCTFQLPPIRIAAFGAASVLVMPAIRFGFGVELTAALRVVHGAVGLTGTVGLEAEIGWQCASPQPCEGLANLTNISDVKPKFDVPSLHQMEVELSGQVFGLIGLDLAVLGGLGGYFGIAEARLGPKQSANFGFEDDQAKNASSSSAYDLALVGKVGPGPGLAAAIKKAINDDSVSVNLTANINHPISKSPRGTFTVDKTQTAIGENVKFTVDITGGTQSYVGIDYNIVSIDFYRRPEGEDDYTLFDDVKITPTASNQTHFEKTWKPKAADVGKNEFAAFVHTEVHDIGLLPLLEIADDSVKQVEVQAICAPQLTGRRPPAAAAPGGSCQVDGSLSHSLVSDSPGSQAHSDSHATLHFNVDPDASSPLAIVFRPEGTCGMTLTASAGGCTTTATSTTCTIISDRSGLTVTIDDTVDPPVFHYAATVGADVTLHETIECPTGTTTFDVPVIESLMMVPASENRIVGPGGEVQGTRDEGGQGINHHWTWDLTLEIPNQPPPPTP